MRLVLTRHGRTVENDAGILQWHLPGKLNEKGQEQARRVALRLRDEHFDHAYSSDLARAADTAREIMRYHSDVPLSLTENLREVYLGEWQGKSKRDLGLLWNPEADTLGPVDGESLDAITERARAFLDRILEIHADESVLLVWHNGINRRLVGVLTWQDSVPPIGNTSVSIFEIDEERKVEIVLFNCSEHLAD